MSRNLLMEPNVEKQIQLDYFQRKSIGMESNLGSLYLDSKACSSSRCLYRGDKNGESNNPEKTKLNFKLKTSDSFLLLDCTTKSLYR